MMKHVVRLVAVAHVEREGLGEVGLYGLKSAMADLPNL
jgi:hypothetical protein